MRWTFVALPAIAAAAALLSRDRRGVRIGAVIGILISLSTSIGALIAPHRLAEDLRSEPSNAAWLEGALATRDVVHGVLPILAVGVISLSVLASIPRSSNQRAESHDQ